MPRDTADKLTQALEVGEAYQLGERALIAVLTQLNDANAKLAKVTKHYHQEFSDDAEWHAEMYRLLGLPEDLS